MTLAEQTERLTAINRQAYPLTLTIEDSESLERCFRRIMDFVHEDDKPLCVGDYAIATSALVHPVVDGVGQSNERVDNDR